jgi:hypothetical protein
MLKKLIILVLIGLSIIAYLLFSQRPTVEFANLYQEQVVDSIVDEPNFIDSSKSAFGYELVSENNFLKLFLNTNTTQFAVVDKRNDFVWYSSLFTSDTQASKSYSNLQKSTIALRYLQKDNTTKTMSNYEFSIQNKQFEIDLEKVEDGFEISYTIGDNSPKGYWYPTKISKERFEELVLTPFYSFPFEDPLYQQELTRYIRNAYVISEEDPDTYTLALVTGDKTSSDLVGTDISYLFEIFYEIGHYGNLQNEFGEYIEEYTLDDLQADNEAYGYELTIDDPEFVVPLRVQLNEDRLDVSVDKDEITFKEPYEIVSMQVLPYMGAASSDKEGYMVLPEGSGGIMYFNNGKVKQRSYRTEIYGDDQTIIPNKLIINDTGSHMPIYGMKYPDNAFLAIINEGQEHASVIAEVSGKNDRFNKVYPEFTYKESGLYYLTEQGISIWNEEVYGYSPLISYYFLTDDDANYTSMASLYGRYLERKYELEVLASREQKLFLDILGSYDFDDYYLFFPYKHVKSLTTYHQAKDIVSELETNDINHLVLNYIGWFNSGIDHEYANNIDIDKVLGNKKVMEEFYAYILDQGHELYYDVDFMNLYDRPMFFKDQYISRIVGGTLAEIYPYDIASTLPDTSKDPYYLLNIQSIDQQLNGFMKDFNRLDIQGLSLRSLGNRLYSDFYRNNGSYRYEIREQLQDFAKDIADQTPVLMHHPNDYMLPFASQIADLKITTSQFLMVDEMIPFIQIALAKYKDYSMPSINIDQVYDLSYYVLKAIETGSHLKYTISYEDSSVLMDTKYNDYYSTTYEKVKDDIISSYEVISDLIGNDNYLVAHEFDTEGYVIVTYQNGLVIKLDYDNLSFEVIS